MVFFKTECTSCTQKITFQSDITLTRTRISPSFLANKCHCPNLLGDDVSRRRFGDGAYDELGRVRFSGLNDVWRRRPPAILPKIPCLFSESWLVLAAVPIVFVVNARGNPIYARTFHQNARDNQYNARDFYDKAPYLMKEPFSKTLCTRA